MSKLRNTVLIVDDDPDFTQLYTVLLERSFDDLDIIHSHTLASAQKCIADQRPTVTVLDIDLPDGQGLAWLSRNAESLDSVVVISSSDAIENALGAGASSCLSKYDLCFDTFVATIGSLLHRSHHAA